MVARLSDAQMMTCTQHALEEYVTEAGRELQRQLMQDQLDARAAAEPRLGQVAGADGVTRRRAETGHRRLVATTVGPVEVNRIAYRAPGAPNLHPADARLALPQRLYSFPLQRQVVHEVAAGSLRQAREALIRTTGQHLGTWQLMQIATDAAIDIRDFYQPAAGPRPDPASTGSRDPQRPRRVRPGHRPRSVGKPRPARGRRPQRSPTRTRRRQPGLGPQRAAAYLHAKQPYLNYHIALTLGWPIATGVIEGCCRYLGKDRLDITGARWSLPSAEAVLPLRAVIANGDLHEYWQFHLNREYQRTHASRYQHQHTLAA